MNWDQRAREYAESRTYKYLSPGENARHAVGVARGARWQRAALLSEETVERVARALYETDREEEAGDEPWPTFHGGLNDMYREQARAALTAAIGDDDE